MAANTVSGGPQVGHMVMYRANASTAYPAVVTRVNANGTVELTTFPVGAAPAMQSAVAHDFTEKKSGCWYQPPGL